MAEEDLASYLKTLEQQLKTGGPAATEGSGPELTLDKIGFGNMFGGAGFAAPAAAAAPPPADGKLRFMLVGTHAQQYTGYSKVTYGIIQELAKLPWLQVTHYGFQKNPETPPSYRPYPPGVRVIDAARLEKDPRAGHGFGIAELPAVLRREQPDVVLIYNDMDIVTKFLMSIRQSGIPRNFQIWVYCDQVYTTQLPVHIDILNRDADRVFAFSPYWKKVLKEQGVTRPLDVILHGFSKDQFYTVPRDIVRKQLGLPKDVFLFMNLNRNQPRKRYDILMMAFAELIVKYPTKPIFLLCICDKGEKGGWPLFEIFERELKMRGASKEQFGDRLMLTSKNMSFRDEDINAFYNAADVGISTAEGEGWGLCTFEQMGVGVPQVVSDVGGYKEFCNAENSILVKPALRYYLPLVHSQVGGEASVCLPHDVCLAMEEYLLDSAKREKHGAAAKETVLSYTWERATKQLVKRLKERHEEETDE
jgi:glycosyltransferase involved in cell wall biosynthesis